MTQYLLSVIHAPGLPHLTEDEIQQSFVDTGAFNDEIVASGHFVFAGGLEPVTAASVVDNTQGANVITDGPYVETKEALGGFWVIEAADLDEARAIAARGSFACKNIVEVRPFQGVVELEGARA
ncbi:MAG: YciI family protein [Propionibacteriales bacterium]|nr:YciI family protein [Propionibacteriales bacterium]